MSTSFDTEFGALLTEAEHHLFGQARGWLNYDDLAVYLRIGRRVVPGENYPQCVQIANLNIAEVSEQRKGKFSRMLSRIMSLTEMSIYVEAVHNQEFAEALLRRGFVVVRSDFDGVSRDLYLSRVKHLTSF